MFFPAFLGPLKIASSYKKQGGDSKQWILCLQFCKEYIRYILIATCTNEREDASGLCLFKVARNITSCSSTVQLRKRLKEDILLPLQDRTFYFCKYCSSRDINNQLVVHPVLPTPRTGLFGRLHQKRLILPHKVCGHCHISSDRTQNIFTQCTLYMISLMT